jgi:probable rRNA maturation factor
MRQILVRGCQREHRLCGRCLRQCTRVLLEELLQLPTYALGIHLVSRRRMAALNHHWLQHEGPTDVIAFDHRADDPALALYGELFVCPAVAIAQAAAFRTTWTEELVRYVVHGVLHLRGYDDHTPAARRLLKRREHALLKALARRPAITGRRFRRLARR